MSKREAEIVLRHIHRMAALSVELPAQDRSLLERFAVHRDESAFAALLDRYAALVLRVCRRILHDSHEAEDAFQATFLILARQAGTIRKHPSLGSWLYMVSYHVAIRARSAAARRNELPADAPRRSPVDPLVEVSGRELMQVLDEELQRLPEKYRAPLLLCYLEGQTQDEAARRLGWSPQTLRGRVERGRTVLRRRLIRRGFGLPAALAGTLLEQTQAPAALIAHTLRAVGSSSELTGGVSAHVAALVQSGLSGPGATKLKLALSLVLMLAVLGAGAGLAGLQAPTEKTPPAQSKETENPPPKRRGDVHSDPLPADALARMGTTRLRQGDTIYGLAFSPDGKTLASGGNRYYGDDRAVCLWNVSTGRLLRSFRAPGHSIRYLAFSPDGKTLATAGGDKTIRLWDTDTGQEVRRLGSRPLDDDILAFSPDGKRLATTASRLKGRPITLWNPATGEELLRLNGRENSVVDLTFAPDGKTLASFGDGPNLVLWDIVAGKEVRRIAVGDDRMRWPIVAFTPDGKRLVTGHADNTLRLWDAATGEKVRSFRGHSGRIVRLAFSADGTTLISASWDKTIRFWDVATGKARRTMTINIGFFSLGPTAFSPGEKMLAVGGANHAIALWDMASGKELRPTNGHQAPIVALAFSPNGEAVTSVSWDRTFRRWDARTGRELRRSSGLQATLLSTPILLNPKGYDVVSLINYAIGLSSDGRLLATGERDNVGRLHLWDVARGKELPFPAAHPGSVISLAISPDGRIVASGGWDKTVRLWDVATGKALHCLTGHQDTVYSVRFSPDGKWLASASGERDHTVRVWDTITGKELHRLRHETSVFVVAFSADGRTLAAAGGQYANEKPGYTGIVLWEMASGKERGRLLRRERVVAALAFSPDNRSLASASTDGTVHVWDSFTGGERGRFAGHQGLVKSLAFSSDSRRLVSGGSDTTALVWDVARLPAGMTREEPIRGEEREAVCKELADVDAERAYKMMVRLSASPDVAALLKERLRPIVSVDAQKVARWIGELDSETFAVREQAAGELAKLGDRAEAALRQALGKSPSLEARRRMEALLDMLSPISPELLFSARAVEVLEHNGTPKARELLRHLAGGDAEARLTREAKAALDRLSRRPSP